jgi:hypothetical protein
MPRLRFIEPCLNSPICLHGIVFNYIMKYRDDFTFTFYHHYRKGYLAVYSILVCGRKCSLRLRI